MTQPAITMNNIDSTVANLRTERSIAWIISFACAIILYRITMAPGLLWGDSGEAQLHTLLPGWLVADQIARSHVLFYAISTSLAKLPFLNAATAANTVSVLGGAITIANLAWILSSLCRRRIAVIAGTLLLLFAHTFWQLSTQAEMLTLTTALLTLEAIALIKLIETRKLRWLALLAFANGLGISNHNFALLMWPVYAILALRFWPRWSNQRPKSVMITISFLLLGLLPILLLSYEYWRTHGSIVDTVKSLLVGDYGPQVKNSSHLPKLLKDASAAVLLNFPTPLLSLVPLGIVHARRTLGAIWCWYFFVGAIVFGAFASRYDVPDQYTFMLPFLLFLTIFMALGVDHLLANRKHSPAMWIAAMTLACLGPIVYAAAPPIIRSVDPDFGPMPTRKVPYRDRLDWFLRPWRIGYDGPERFARETLTSLPENAMFVVDSSLCPPIYYLQVAEGLRKDVRLDSVVAIQNWHATIEDRDREHALSGGYLFTSSDDPDYLPCWLRSARFRFEPFGHAFRVLPASN